MSEQTGTPPAGWYNDPGEASQQRWWDGAQWSSSTRPLHDSPPPAMPPPNTLSAPAAPPASDPFDPDPFRSAAPTPLGGPPNLSGRKRGRSVGPLVLIVGALVLVLGGCVALLTARSSEPAQITDRVTVEEATPPDSVSEAESVVDDAELDEPTPVEPEADEPEPAVSQTMGTRSEPLPYDQPVDLIWNTIGDADGSVWTTTIGPPRDITDDVLAANEFNDPPPVGTRYLGFDAELTLVEAAKEPLAPSFNFGWEILGGATAKVIDPSTIETDSFGCGVTPNSFDDFAEVFTGGTLTGTICIPVPVEDLDHPDTRVALNFADGDRAIFGP